MPTINQLPVLNVISSGDQLPVYSPNNGDARRTSIGSLLTFFQQSFASPTLAVNLFVPGNGFNITVPTPVSQDQWMLLQPAGTLATGTITLPLNTGVPDGTTVLITTTQQITSLTIALNGATALYGGVSFLGAGTATAIRFYQPTNSWYQITADAVYAAGIQTWLANPTSANLRAAMTDETGTGLLVFNNTPTDMTFNGLTIGRGLTSAATNTALGISTLSAVTTATDCTAVGASALAANTTGLRNTAVGVRTLTSNLSGLSNTAVGFEGLQNNSTGGSNVAIGRSPLFDNTIGSNNIAIGTVALTNNISGSNNIAIGLDSQFTHTTGISNIGIGFATLFTSTGDNNIAIGDGALYTNTTGFHNLAIGFDAMFTNTTGDGCVAIGKNSLKLNLSGEENVAVGFEALRTNSTGSYNTAMGFQALYASTSSNNVGIGYAAANGCTSGGSNTGIGTYALSNVTTGSGNTGINPMNSSNTFAPVFNVTTENNRFVAGSTGVTNAYVQVAWTVVSDARDKTDFAPVPHGLDFVTKLKPTTYRYKANRSDTEGHGPLRYGFKAQDVLELEGDNPIIVDTEDLEKLKLNDQSMIAVLVKAIQELKAELDAYKANQESQT